MIIEPFAEDFPRAAYFSLCLNYRVSSRSSIEILKIGVREKFARGVIHFLVDF